MFFILHSSKINLHNSGDRLGVIEGREQNGEGSLDLRLAGSDYMLHTVVTPLDALWYEWEVGG